MVDNSSGLPLPVSLMAVVLALAATLGYCLSTLPRLRSVLFKTLHILPFTLALLIGGLTAGPLGTHQLLLAALLFALTQILIVQNNVYDRLEDESAGRNHGLSPKDANLGHILAVALLLAAAWLDPLPGGLLACYYLLGTVYHHPLVRAKKHFPLPYLFEGVAGALCVLCGMVSHSSINIENLAQQNSLIVPPLAFAGFALSSVFKDYKDIEGDRVGGVTTLYTFLLDRGFRLLQIQLLVLTQVTASHLLFVLGAVLLGAPMWQGTLLAMVLAAGFAFLLLRAKPRVLAVEGVLLLDVGMLLWFLCLNLPLHHVFT